MANSGRPKKDDCNNIIKVSVNDETASMLDTAASLTGKSKSDILRELIPLVSSRTFEDMISSTNMELLQQYSKTAGGRCIQRAVFLKQRTFQTKASFHLNYGTPGICEISYI